MSNLTLYNTLSRGKSDFVPIDPTNVRMYVCGPTVYDRAHLGNARSVVVYDVLYRLLKQLYPTVTYVRNITDVDDKINAAAKANGEPISALTTRVTKWFHEDMNALGVLSSTLPIAPSKNPEKAIGHSLEPKATDHITEMLALIERLFNNGNAYIAAGHVLFDVNSSSKNSHWQYGMLSNRVQEDLESGARVKVESYKRHPNDFVLWKPAAEGDDPSSVFDCGAVLTKLGAKPGRPGWHIECSAMSTHYLGDTFDIHGGGADLMFPHHENEIAQSCCASPSSSFAKFWVHNGFLTVNGEKMSKSLGNFITVRDLLDKGVKGEVIRYALLKTKYNEPLDWSEKLLSDAQKELDKLYRRIGEAEKHLPATDVPFTEDLLNDLNTPMALAKLHQAPPEWLKKMGSLLGLLQQSPEDWFKGTGNDDSAIQSQIDARVAAKKAKNWKEADHIRDELKAQGILLEDKPDGSSDWRKA